MVVELLSLGVSSGAAREAGPVGMLTIFFELFSVDDDIVANIFESEKRRENGRRSLDCAEQDIVEMRAECGLRRLYTSL